MLDGGASMRVPLIKTLAAASVAFCFSVSAQAEEEKVLNVYNWSDYIAADTLAKFTAATGIKVNYDVYDSNEVVQVKLQAGKSGYDVVFPSASPFIAQQIKAGIYQKLDKAKIPNYANLDPTMMDTLSRVVDPGNLYAVPYMVAATGIGVNLGKIKTLAPDAPLDSWALVFDPAHASRLKGCGISFLDTPTEAFAAALVYKGKDGASQSSEDLKLAVDTMAAIRPFVKYFHSSKYINDLANGDICIAHGYGGDLIQARNRAREAGNGVDIKVFVPKEGAVVNIDAAVIPANAPHPDNAHAFINFLLQPEIIAAISNEVGFANAVPASKEFMNKDVVEDAAIYPDEAILAKEFQVPPATQAFDRERTRAWTRLKSGR